jgi:hypothetical protein
LEKHYAPNRVGPLLSAAQLYFKTRLTHLIACLHARAWAPFRSCHSDRAPTPTATAVSRPRQLPPQRASPVSQSPHATHAAAILCAAPLATTSAPRATHAAAAPCVTPSCCQSVGEAVSPLPSTVAERHPLCSALTALLCSKRRSTDHPTPLSCVSAPRQAGH